MIRKIIGCAFLFMVFAAVNLTFAQEHNNTGWITGEVVSMKMDRTTVL